MSVEPTSEIERPATGVGSGRMVSLMHLSLRYPRFEEDARWQAKKVADEWKALGEQMMLHRKAAGLSLRQLAEMLKISPAFLSDMERGARHYTLRHAGPAMKIYEANNGDEPTAPRATENK